MGFRHVPAISLRFFSNVRATGGSTLTVDAVAILRPGDAVLVEGGTRISVAIKYLTQSSWSHACLFVGESACPQALLEADLQEGQVNSAAALLGFQFADMPSGQTYGSDRLRLISHARSGWVIPTISRMSGIWSDF